jgi:uncharacterized protein
VTVFGVELVNFQGDELTRFLVIGGLAVLLLSMAKAGFGGSVGLLAVPMMIYAVGDKASLSVGLMLPILIATDYMNILVWWRKWRWPVVAKLLPGAVVGILIGWALLKWMGYGGDASAQAVERQKLAEGLLKLAIGLIALSFVVIRSIQALRAKPMVFKPVMWQSTIAGGVAGSTSTLAHAAGPVTAMYMLPQHLGKDTYVATTVLYYWIGNQLKLVPYLSLGMINRQSLLMGLVLVPAVPVGVLLGRYFAGKINEKVFTVIVYVLLGLAGVDMCIKAAIKLLG